MNKRILFVDDDANILSSFKRMLYKDYAVTVANSPEEGLDFMRQAQTTAPFAVVVSDFKMPKMNGVDFLKQCYTINKNTVRILLTGYADVNNAMSAVNEGHVFRFLAKPVEHELLRQVLDAGIEQYMLVTAEKELLRGTLQGSIKLMSEIFSIIDPDSFGQTERIRRTVNAMVKNLDIENGWQVEIAALLCQIGFIAVPDEILEKAFYGNEMSFAERKVYLAHTTVAGKLIRNIPRLHEVANIVEHFEYSPKDRLNAPVGSRIIRIARDYDLHLNRGATSSKAIREMKAKIDLYDPRILAELESAVSSADGYLIRSLKIAELKEGMILRENIETVDKLLLLRKGATLCEASILRLNTYGISMGIREPIDVLVPQTPEK